MFEFLTPICVVGIITLGIYKLFELFARRRERMTIAEKLEGASLLEYLKMQPQSVPIPQPSFSRGGIRTGCLLLGLGLGLLVAALINYYFFMRIAESLDYTFLSAIYSGSLLFGGGLGLVVAYIIEWQTERKK